jgi:high-affinity nickel-transport protein
MSLTQIAGLQSPRRAAPVIAPVKWRWRNAETSARARLVPMYLIIVAGNIASWFAAWTLFSDEPMLMSAAVLAYILGLRHAVDADHIAAIDNVVRRLVQSGQKPVATGFFFSLGHSTVVFLAVVAIAVTASALQGEFASFRAIGAIVGKALGALLLLAIGAANLVVLVQLWKAVKRPAGIPIDPADIDLLGPPGGALARLCTPIFRTISHSWRMFPLGFLFGLSFDTATEVSLLGISASQASQEQIAWSILVFPALFAAGMTLVDTTDGVLMTRAYGWALVNPVRKLWYNFTMTLASVAVAVFIGGVQIVTLFVDHVGLEGRVWRIIAGLGDDLTTFGLIIVGIFIGTWIASAAIYRWQQYSAAVADAA